MHKLSRYSLGQGCGAQGIRLRMRGWQTLPLLHFTAQTCHDCQLPDICMQKCSVHDTHSSTLPLCIRNALCVSADSLQQ